jgi:hypothetical protein
MGTSNGKYDVPHTLEFTWYSVVEDKFYAGHWSLDKERMTELFKEGFWVEKYRGQDFEEKYFTKETYDFIDIGLAPAGRIVVWMRGEMGSVEVGCFQAQEINITKEEAYDSFKYVFRPGYRTKMLKSRDEGGLTDPLVYARIKEKGYADPKVYHDYRERFNWTIKYILPEGSRLTTRGAKMCNGEVEAMRDNEHGLVIPYTKRAIPYYVSVSWETRDGIDMGSKIVFTENQNHIRLANQKYNGQFLPWDFNDTDLYKLFKEKLDRDLPIEIVIDVSNNKGVVLYVTQEGKKHPINQMDNYVEPY